MLWSSDVGLDVGTAKTRAYVQGQGMVLTTESAVAISSRTGNPVAVGDNAAALTPGDQAETRILRPVNGGVIADVVAAKHLLSHVLSRALSRKRPLARPMVVTAVPPGATPVERTALEQALLDAGARRVLLVNSTLAGALGAGIGVNQTTARLLVDLGAGITDLGVISGGAVLRSRSLRFGGEDLDKAIQRFVRRKYGLTITAESAAQVKLRVGSVFADLQQQSVSLEGVEVYGELFKSTTVPLDEVPNLLRRHLSLIAAEIRWLLDELPPGQREEIMTTGLTLVGGTAQLRGLARLMTQKLHLPASVAPQPAECVCSGLGMVLQNPGRLRLDGCQFYATDQ